MSVRRRHKPQGVASCRCTYDFFAKLVQGESRKAKLASAVMPSRRKTSAKLRHFHHISHNFNQKFQSPILCLFWKKLTPNETGYLLPFWATCWRGWTKQWNKPVRSCLESAWKMNLKIARLKNSKSLKYSCIGVKMMVKSPPKWRKNAQFGGLLP